MSLSQGNGQEEKEEEPEQNEPDSPTTSVPTETKKPREKPFARVHFKSPAAF